MSRTELIAQSRRITAASDIVAAYGTRQQVTYRGAYLARGRFADVIAMGAGILASVPQSAYALTA